MVVFYWKNINHLGKARFKNIDPITDNEVAELITKISERVILQITEVTKIMRFFGNLAFR